MANKRLFRSLLGRLLPATNTINAAGNDEMIAKRLSDPEKIAKARVFPYQLLVAYKMAEANQNIPLQICNALQDAMEIATRNVPALPGTVYVFPDVSSTSHCPCVALSKGPDVTTFLVGPFFKWQVQATGAGFTRTCSLLLPLILLS